MKAVHTSSPLTFTPEKSENVLLNKLYPHHVLALEGLGLSSRKIYPTFGISPGARRCLRERIWPKLRLNLQTRD